MTTAQDPWDIGRRHDTVRQFLGVGSDAGLPDAIRFVRSVSGLARKRMPQDAPSGGFAYFLLYPPSSAPTGTYELHRIAMLDVGRDRVTHRLWFVNCVANDGAAIEIGSDETHAAIVERITNDFALGHVPAFVLDTTDVPTARFFPDGLSDLQSVVPVSLVSESVDWDRIKVTVDRVHRTSLVTPEVQNRTDSLWANAPNYWAASDAEYKVQSAIKAALAGAFPYCDIRAEQPQAEGRHDLLIEEAAEDDVGAERIIPHAMIEIKVLRSRNSSGTSVSSTTTADWALSGVKQAYSYGVGRHSHLYIAMLVDARRPPEDMDCLRETFEEAERLDVIVGVWQVYGRSADLRTELAGER